MISPYGKLPVLIEGPRRNQSVAKRFRFIFNKLVNRNEIRSEDQLEDDLRTLLNEVVKCADRDSLVRVIGKPDYVVCGKHFVAPDAENRKASPDFVECYSIARLNVELWFLKDTLVTITGYVMPGGRD